MSYKSVFAPIVTQMGGLGNSIGAMTTNSSPTPTHYLVVDLEATTSNDGSLPLKEMETIEIGALLVEANSLAVVDEFQSFVRPVRHPILSPFCTELTGITQEMVDAAPGFRAALEMFQQQLFAPSQERVLSFASWGQFDKAQFERDCALHAIPYPMPEHVNFRGVFSGALGQRRRYGMAEALEMCGLPLTGAHHRALDDARNLVSLMPWILGRRSPAGVK